MIKKSSELLERFAKKLSLYLPFNADHDVLTAVGQDGGSLLDVGCGKGQKMALVNKEHRALAVGVDIFLPYLRLCKSLCIYDDLVRGDVRRLPFRAESFDVVIGLEIVEHLEKQDGIKLIKDMEAIAREKVVLSMPIGVHVLHNCDNNPYQEHKSCWVPQEMKLLGYRVRANGIRGTVGEAAFVSHLPRIIQLFWRAFCVGIGPVIRLCPQAGGHMVCWKKIA